MSYQSDMEIYKGYRISLEYDDAAADESPRSWGSNFETMICWHNKYTLGDKHDHRDPQAFLQNFLELNYEETLYAKLMRKCERKGNQLGYNWEPTIEDMFPIFQQVALVLPIWAYEHGGITLSTSGAGYPFCDRFDAGQVGWSYVTLDDVRAEFHKQRLFKKTIERAYEIMRQEVKTYDQFITGDVYYYTISEWTGDEPYDEDEYEYDDEDEELWQGVDGMGGLYGSDYAMEEARRMVDYLVEEKAKEAV